MEELAATAVLQEIALGEVDLDRITEALRSAELIIKSYRSEVETMQRAGEQLKASYEQEKNAVNELTKRLVELHEENNLAKGVFRAEIEGKWKLLGAESALDLEALDMAGLIRERETVQKRLGQALQSR